jgi:hypothetical protein
MLPKIPFNPFDKLLCPSGCKANGILGSSAQERQHFSRKLKWGPSDFSSEKFAGG